MLGPSSLCESKHREWKISPFRRVPSFIQVLILVTLESEYGDAKDSSLQLSTVSFILVAAVSITAYSSLPPGKVRACLFSQLVHSRC